MISPVKCQNTKSKFLLIRLPLPNLKSRLIHKKDFSNYDDSQIIFIILRNSIHAEFDKIKVKNADVVSICKRLTATVTLGIIFGKTGISLIDCYLIFFKNQP